MLAASDDKPVPILTINVCAEKTARPVCYLIFFFKINGL